MAAVNTMVQASEDHLRGLHALVAMQLLPEIRLSVPPAYLLQKDFVEEELSITLDVYAN
jgi:hypothetical protein